VLFQRYIKRIPTPELNRAIEELRAKREPPQKHGRRLNLLYATQIHQRPPRLRIFVNDPSLITRDYAYWVENSLRDRFEMEGVPVSIDFVKKT
jgi:GTP-binding protein